MINEPWLILGVLLVLEIGILYLDNHPRYHKLFSFLPSVFWIYFLPMVLASLGIIDSKAKILSQFSQIFLPASLFILLTSVDIKAILKLGKTALIMFLMGGVGIVLGAVVAFVIFKPFVGDEFWMGFGTLTGSWTGGSANMIAVKEALSVPDQVFLPMVLVDTIVSYSWMGVMVSMVKLQGRFDAWNHSNRHILDELAKKVKTFHQQTKIKMSFGGILLILGLGWAVSFAASRAAQFLPEIKDVISPYTWTIILVSILGIMASFTPVRKLESIGSNKIGYFMLYFVLTTIGAKANIGEIGSSWVLVFAGILIVLIHFSVLLLTARVLKAPMFLVTTACQANIGGVASAPIVAEIYQPGLASVGLLLAILGNIIGTYFGILAAELCRLFLR